MKFSTNKLIFRLICMFLLVVSVACSDSKTPPSRSIDPKPAPEFSIQAIDGQTIDRNSLKGKIVLLNLWAIWSPGCAREIPELIQLLNSLPKNQREKIAVIGICLESNNLGDIKLFAEQLGIDYPLSVQENTFADQFGSIDAIPSTFIIDPDWNLVNRYTGKMQQNDLRYELEYMLAEIKAKEKAE